MISINEWLKSINQNLSLIAAEKKKNKVDTIIEHWVPILLSTAALIASFYFYSQGNKDQSKTQAYTYWQNYLELAVQYPQLANGIDSIDGISISEIARWPSEGLTQQDSIRKASYIKYAWFVVNGLTAGEIIFDLHKDDVSWRSALKEALGGHKSFFQSIGYKELSYDKGFQCLLMEAAAESTKNDQVKKTMYNNWLIRTGK